MARFDGSLARMLDFETAPNHRYQRRLATAAAHRSPRRLELLRGPDKYAVLERRRRAAQIKARHALDLIDVMERASEAK